MSELVSPVKTIEVVPDVLKGYLDQWIASNLKVDVAKFNEVLLRNKAVVAGSFFIPPVSMFLRSRVRFQPSDVDIWVESKNAPSILSDLKLLLQGKAWFKKPPIVRVVKKNFDELSQYRRLSEDVDSIYVIDTRRNSPGDERIPLQILACRNLSRALGSFDLNVCALAWTGASLQTWVPHVLSSIRDGVMSVNAKALSRQSASELTRTLSRVRKYTKYGFRLSSVQPLVTALHEHFGVDCSEGAMLCENYVAYFMDGRMPKEYQETLEKQKERYKLVRFLLHRVNTY
jgi:hypothetical protein